MQKDDSNQFQFYLLQSICDSVGADIIFFHLKSSCVSLSEWLPLNLIQTTGNFFGCA